MRVTLTFFRSLYVAEGQRVRTYWPAFFARCAKPTTPAGKNDASRWSAATFMGDKRANANVETVAALVYDVDDGTTIDALANAMGDVYGMITSTWSHTPTVPRWRPIIPLSRPVTRAEFDRVWRAGAMRIETVGRPDYAARDSAHVWSVPAVPRERVGDYVCRILAGPIFDVEAALALIPKTDPEPEVATSPATSRHDTLERRMERARAWLAHAEPAISGAGGHRQAFKVASAVVRGFELPEADALALLSEEWNPRCEPPWSAWELKRKVREAATRARLAPGWLANAGRRCA
jgi:hypothetical protein